MASRRWRLLASPTAPSNSDVDPRRTATRVEHTPSDPKLTTTQESGGWTGGLAAVFAATILFTLGDGSIQLILAPHLEAQGAEPGAIGPIVAAYSVAALGLRFVAGAAYTPETSRYLAALGCMASSLSFLVIATSDAPLVLTLAVGLNGAGFGLTSTTVLAAVMDIQREGNAGVTMGLYTGFIGAGYALANLLGGVAGDLLGLSRAITWLALLPALAAVAFLFSLAGLRSSGHGDHAAKPGQRRIGGFANISVFVWLAFFCALHINLLSGVLHTFFPLYGLTIGLSLTQIGLLAGMSAGISSAVRFGASAVFRSRSYRPSLPWMVGVGSIATASLVLSERFWPLVVAWAFIGLSRGVLRVGSAALAMDGSHSPSRGAASGLYMAGLDIGRIIGPVVGGVGVSLIDYRGTFLLAGIAIPVVFFVAYTMILVRERREASAS